MTADRIAAVLAEHPVWDGHNDLPWELRKQVAYDLNRMDLAGHCPTLHTDIPRLRTGGVGAQFFSVFVPGTLPEPEALVATVEQIDCVKQIIARHPDTFVAARTASDVETAWAGGRIAALMGAEGGHSIVSNLAVLRMLWELGVGYLTLTHNQNVPWADSATDVPATGGLSEFGRDVVREMNTLGMLVDLSHVAVSTMNAALDVSVAPVIFSHSSCRALTDHVRDVPDAVLDRLADNGGIQMITFVTSFVSQECADHDVAEEAERVRLGLPAPQYGETAATRAERDEALQPWRSAHPIPAATLAQVADHVDHARERAGVDHIGLGGDYDGTTDLPVGLEDVSTYPALLAELADRGWSDADLGKLTSGNMLRVMAAAEEVANA